MKGWVDDLQTSQVATAEIAKVVERQKGLVLEAKRLRRSVCNHVASLREWIAAAGTRDAQLRPNMLAVSDQIVRATAVLWQARDTIAAQSMELAKVALLRSSIKSLEDNVAFSEVNEN